MNSKTVYRLKVQGKDGITFDVDSKMTIYTVMDFVCENWLDIIRDGDGGINDHLWKIYKPLPPRPNDSTLFLEDAENRKKRREYYEAEEQADDGFPKNTTLEELTWFRPGKILKVEYDYGDTTSFDILFLSEEKMNSSSNNNDGTDTATNMSQLPAIVPPATEIPAKNFIPYQPPENSPNLDTIFPHANQLMFASGDASRVCPYPCSRTSAGFIDGPYEYGAYILLLPVKFSGIYEALVAIDLVMKRYPLKQNFVVDGDISRMAFPLKMTKAKEEKFLAYEKDIKHRMSSREMHPFKQHKFHFYSPESEGFVRITQENMKEYHHHDDKNNINCMAQFFPLCTKAYDVGLWASYRRGKVTISQVNGIAGELGEPKEILAQVSQNIVSLHQFFCVCEALFRRVEAGPKFESIKRSVQTNPNNLIDATKRRKVG